MPTYQYKCSACKANYEALQKMSDDPLKICTYCKRETLKRVPSAGLGFVLNGSGWYNSQTNAEVKHECCPCGKNSKETHCQPTGSESSG